MRQCKDYDTKKELGHIKIPLNGTINTCCDKDFIIYDSNCLDSFGTITFENKACCEVEIYKNNLRKPVAVIEPGINFTLTSSPFCRIVVKCMACSYYRDNQCKKHGHYIRHTCSYTKCQTEYDWGQYACNTKYKKSCYYNKCIVHYEGFVFAKVDNEPCSHMC